MIVRLSFEVGSGLRRRRMSWEDRMADVVRRRRMNTPETMGVNTPGVDTPFQRQQLPPVYINSGPSTPQMATPTSMTTPVNTPTVYHWCVGRGARKLVTRHGFLFSEVDFMGEHIFS